MASPNLTITDRWRTQEAYSPKKRRVAVVVPQQNRAQHGGSLLSQAEAVRERFTVTAREWDTLEEIRSRGIIIEFESMPGFELHTESWSDRKIPKFELLNVVESVSADGLSVVKQRWFIRDGALEEFVRIFRDYLAKTTNKGEPKRGPLVNSIGQIRVAALAQLWTEREDLPADNVTSWYEVWLRAGANDIERSLILRQFRSEAHRLGLQVGEREEKLPEHTVLHVHGAFGLLGRSTALMNCVAEIRQVYNYASIYDRQEPGQQQQAADDLRQRTVVRADGSLAVCVLDTGVERGHPLLQSIIAAGDNQTISAPWGVADDKDHGTPMSGIVAYENLAKALATPGPFEVPFVLEGMKIVPPPAVMNRDEKHAAEYTAQGVGQAEVTHPDRSRVWCLATSMEGPHDGRPSSWSSRIDQLAAGVDNGGEVRRIFCVSAGNVPKAEWNNYPRSNHQAPVENPGHAWNALCVGGFTEYDRLDVAVDRQGYAPIALRGAIAPCSRTSLLWDKEWPPKPDVVFEAGNGARRQQRDAPMGFSELLLLSTEADFRRALFTTFDGTSAATALASRMAAQIALAYPDFWPETIRGMLVHSAEWTTAMRSTAPATRPGSTVRLTDKEQREFLLKTVGYGSPRADLVLGNERNRATLVAQAELQPFQLNGPNAKYNEYHVYSLPWPKATLEGLVDQEVRLRVTLSYFIEPNPGNRVTSRYRYPGCRLRFKVSAPGQRVNDLKAQVNRLAEEDADREEREWVRADNAGWLLGSNNIFRGSVHSDIWEGPAANLLSMQHIAVFPTSGWWKTRLGLRKADSRIKYSLIASLESAGAEVDLYTDIANQIRVPVVVGI